MSNLLIEASPRIAPDALRRLRHPIAWITVVGAVAGFAVAPSTEMPTAFALAVLLLLVGVSVPLTEFVQGRLDAMNLRNVFAFYYCYMFSGYFFYLALGNEAQYHIDWYKREASVVRAFILCIVGLVCFYVGFHLRVGELLSRRVPYFPRYWSARRMWLVYAASLAGGVMAFFVIMRAGGGISNYLTTINYSRVHAIGGKAYFFVALNMVATAGATTYVYGAARRSRWLRLLGIATLLMYAPLVMATGYRGPILFALIWFMALRHYYVKPLRVRLPAILLFASIILVFHSYAILRSVLTKATGSVVVAAIDAMTQPEFWLELPSIVVGREAGIEYVVRTMEGMRFVEEPPLGVDVVKEVISTPIPRAFWPDKIVPFSFRFTNTFYSDLYPPDG
ncbi:MAG: hypothetical protein O3A46_13830, partial [Candidatus Poribacteria bacterium]|nr:hypothetical protein [Candidatus Poribacteria bacterium]